MYSRSVFQHVAKMFRLKKIFTYNEAIWNVDSPKRALWEWLYIVFQFLFQWRCPQSAFILYRILSAGFALAILLWTSITVSANVSTPYKWYWYLTFWSYIALTVYFVLSSIVTAFCSAASPDSCYKSPVSWAKTDAPPSPPRSQDRSYISGNEYSGSSHEGEDATVVMEMPSNPTAWYLKMTWMLFAVCSTLALFVTLMYFSALYPMLPHGDSIQAPDLFLHGLNSVLIVLDICISAMPFRLFHMIYPALFGLVYVIFSIVLWTTDRSIVLYGRLLDWNYPGTTIAVITGCLFIVLPILQFLLFTLYKIRSVIYSKIYAWNVNSCVYKKCENLDLYLHWYFLCSCF